MKTLPKYALGIVAAILVAGIALGQTSIGNIFYVVTLIVSGDTTVGSSGAGDFFALHTATIGAPGDQVVALTASPGISSQGGTGISTTSIDGTSPVQPQPGLVASGEGTVAGSTGILAIGNGSLGIGVTGLGSALGAAGDFTSGGVGVPATDAPAVQATGSSSGVPVICTPGTDSAAIRLIPRAGAPSTPQEGDVWLATGGGLHYYLGGVDHLVTAVPP